MAKRITLGGVFHIETDNGKITPVMVSYLEGENEEKTQVQVNPLAPCHYQNCFFDLDNSFLVKINDLCDLEFDDQGHPLPENLGEKLHYFLDEDKKKIVCKLYLDSVSASEGYLKVKVFRTCKKYGYNHRRRDTLFIQKHELEEVVYGVATRVNKKRKKVLEIK